MTPKFHRDAAGQPYWEVILPVAVEGQAPLRILKMSTGSFVVIWDRVLLAAVGIMPTVDELLAWLAAPWEGEPDREPADATVRA